MAAWLLPAIKAVLPHVGSIVSAAVPVFTQRKPQEDAAAGTVPQQIAELQAAAAQNGQHLRDLAAQLQQTVSALESAAAQLDRQLTLTRRVAWTALAVALVATVIAVFL